MNYMDKLVLLQKECKGYWIDRITTELRFACSLSERAGLDAGVAIREIDMLYDMYKQNKGISPEACMAAEKQIAPVYGDAAKAYRLIHVGHAHIDMNWMWRYDETVAITLDTFRTMLALMDQYPEFTFMQSQASVYKIVEEFAPEMMDEIRRRVKEGRWEVTANTWVEADKNMPSGESMARHLLYTREYMKGLLNIDDSHFQIDFEPDTFGHSAHVPDVLAQSGVNYYYHCRGYGEYPLYKWEAPSGRSVLMFCEPSWYNSFGPLEKEQYSLWFEKQCGSKTMIWVYGVGDHGGGPTRREVAEIMDHQNWPVYPSMVFGTLLQFFQEMEKYTANIPVIKHELNYTFSGCYTTQTRIKQGNSVCQRMLRDAEAVGAMAHITTGYPYNPKTFNHAWRNVLFNQFHDILTGSGTIDTREYALGLYQQTMAVANTRRIGALRSLATRINTAPLAGDQDLSTDNADGAGVGFGVEKFGVTQVSITGGMHRPFHVFNTTPYERDGLAEVVVWDWPGEAYRLGFTDGNGNALQHQLMQSEGRYLHYTDAYGNEVPHTDLKNGVKNYWQHFFFRVLVKVQVPAMGYATCILDQKAKDSLETPISYEGRQDKFPTYKLENDSVCAIFDPKSLELVSFMDKASGQDMVNANKPAGFRFITEDTILGMAAWIVGRNMKDEPVQQDKVFITEHVLGQQLLRQWITFEVAFGTRSSLKATVSLEKGSSVLRYDVSARFLEVGTAKDGIKQLHFSVPLSYEAKEYRCDVPMGDVRRDPYDSDMPALTFAAASHSKGNGLMMMSDCKHGFLCLKDSMGLTLIRGAYEPDPLPELYDHTFSLGLSPVAVQEPQAPFVVAEQFVNPLIGFSGQFHAGDAPLTRGFFQFEKGSAALSAIKMAEDGNGIIVRFYHLSEKKEPVVLSFVQPVQSAACADVLEQPCDCKMVAVAGNKITVPMDGRESVAIRVTF